MRAAFLGLVVVTVCSCEQGTRGAVGAVGPQGLTGAAGAKGEPGAQGPRGDPGQVLVVAAADGGAVSFDGGLAIISGPQGSAGERGVPGQSVVASSAPVENCRYGGTRFDSASAVTYVCNGAPGSPGPQGASGEGGERGPPGAKGDTGAIGPQGIALVITSADGGTVSFDGGLAIVAGPAGQRGLPGDRGPAGPGSQLVYFRDTASLMSGQSAPFFMRYGELPVWTTVVGPVISTFAFTIDDPSTNFLFVRLDGAAIAGVCADGVGPPRTMNELQFEVYDTNGVRVGSTDGLMVCGKRGSTLNPECGDGFSWSVTVSPNQLPVGQYDARLTMRPSGCATTMWPGAASWYIGKATLSAWQYRL